MYSFLAPVGLLKKKTLVFVNVDFYIIASENVSTNRVNRWKIRKVCIYKVCLVYDAHTSTSPLEEENEFTALCLSTPELRQFAR